MTCPHCSTPVPDGSHYCSACGADQSDPTGVSPRRAVTEELTEALQLAAAGRYRVIRLLGRGAMGAVFLAEDLRLEREVAIKVLRPDLAEDPECAGRFQREARISARLDHPNIIPIYGVEQQGDFQYFVMKYVRGRSLDQIVREGPLPVERAVSIVWQAACGLGHAHQRGVVHRDVKPSNLMVGDDDHVVVTDFGISKALEAGTQYTSIGQIVGTPRYLSPEQAAGEPLDGRADQYSLAVVGYELLTGRLPLGATTVHALIYAHLNQVPRPAREVRLDIPAHVSDALARALSKVPDRRFATIQEFGTALWPHHPRAAGRPGAPAARSGSPAEAVDEEPALESTVISGSSSRRRRIGAVAAMLAVAIAAVVYSRSRGQSASAPPLVAESAESATRAASVPPAAPAADTIAPPTAAADSMVSATGRDSAAARPVPAAAPVREKRPPPRRTRAAERPAARPADSSSAPPSAQPTLGYLTINAVPYGTVAIDGVEAGDTPLVRFGVPPGQHTFTVAREGFRTDTVRVTVTAGNEIRMSRTLTRATP